MKLQLLTRLALLASMTALAGTLQAQTEPRWYQVDLLIFAHSGVEESNPEQWPTFPNYDKPDQYLKLIYPDTEVEELLEPDENQEITEEALALGLLLMESQDQEEESLIPVAFETLDEENHTLQDYADKLDRDRRYRILFHESWAHPILPEEEALPVYLTGGEDFGTINELAGLVKIHVSRYLHVETNLFFTEVVESDSPFALLTGSEDFSVQAEAKDTLKDLEPFGGLELFTQSNDSLLSESGNNKSHFYVAVSSAQMNAKRRMRSKELHYVDNPKFGLLIYFTPIDMEALLEQQQQVEQENDTGDLERLEDLL